MAERKATALLGKKAINAHADKTVDQKSKSKTTCRCQKDMHKRIADKGQTRKTEQSEQAQHAQLSAYRGLRGAESMSQKACADSKRQNQKHMLQG